MIASDLIFSRSTRTWVLILSLTFFGRLRVRFGHRCSCEPRRACQPRRLLQRLRAENAGSEIYLTTSSLATCIRQSVYDSEVLSINHLRLWAICTHTLAEKGESISVAGACMSFGHASNGPDFDTDSSRNVNLLRLIALASSI